MSQNSREIILGSQPSIEAARHSPRALPWRFVAIVFAALALSAVGAAWLFGDPMVPAALAGMIMGFFGTVIANRSRALLAGAVVLIATMTSIEVPAWVIPAGIAPLMCALSGWEVGKYGTRAFAVGLFAWIMLIGPAGSGHHLEIFPTFIVPLVAGSLIAIGLGAESLASRPAAGARYGRAHALALSIGLAASIVLSWQFDHPGAHWIMTLFVVRALDDPGTHKVKAFRNGIAAILGAITAALLTFMPLDMNFFAVLGVLSLLIGLRFLPLPDAKSSVFMSAGVVLATAPTLDSALYRGAAALVASSLAILLSLGSAYLTERLERTKLFQTIRD